ncbi:MAG: CDP-diacylglycerol--serine O-phosphatidyltransferase [Pseudomonadota bacterium]
MNIKSVKSFPGGDGPNRRKGIYLLPNLLTTTALFAGFYAVVAAIDGNFGAAAIAIYVALVFDGLDGRVARLTNTASDFGKEYDSLSDMVSFGLAPALVMYQWGVARIAEYGWIWGKLGWIAAFFYSVAAALRLARFNTVVAQDKHYFSGLPSPSAAGLVAGMVWYCTEWELTGLGALALAFAVAALAGGLMVSNIKYLSIKHLKLGEKVPFAYLLIIPLTFMLIAIDPPIVLFSLFLSYAASGPITRLFRKIRLAWSKRGKTQTRDDDDHGSTAA